MRSEAQCPSPTKIGNFLEGAAPSIMSLRHPVYCYNATSCTGKCLMHIFNVEMRSIISIEMDTQGLRL